MLLSSPAHAKLGETLDQLIARFGSTYQREDGMVVHFRSPGRVAADAVLGPDGRCIEETYLSRKPLDAKGEPPADIVQAILKANAPTGTKWREANYPAADYALRSEDNNLLAALRYRRPQAEGATWTITVCRANEAAAVAAGMKQTNARGEQRLSASKPTAPVKLETETAGSASTPVLEPRNLSSDTPASVSASGFDTKLQTVGNGERKATAEEIRAFRRIKPSKLKIFRVADNTCSLQLVEDGWLPVEPPPHGVSLALEGPGGFIISARRLEQPLGERSLAVLFARAVKEKFPVDDMTIDPLKGEEHKEGEQRRFLGFHASITESDWHVTRTYKQLSWRAISEGSTMWILETQSELKIPPPHEL